MYACAYVCVLYIISSASFATPECRLLPQALTKTYKGHSSVETILPRVLDGSGVFLQNSAYIEYVTASRFTRKGVAATRMMKVLLPAVGWLARAPTAGTHSLPYTCVHICSHGHTGTHTHIRAYMIICFKILI